MRIEWDWHQTMRPTRGRFQHLRWLWIGPLYITWEKEASGKGRTDVMTAARVNADRKLTGKKQARTESAS